MTTAHVRELTPEYLAQLRREHALEIRREYPRIPPGQFLSPEIVRLDAEVRRLVLRRRQVHAEWQRLTSDDAVREAIDIDREAAVAALRAGKPATSAGAKADQERRQKIADLDAEYGATPSVIKALEQEMRLEFAKVSTDPKTNGRDAEAKGRKAMEKALDDLVTARGAYHGARQFAEFIAQAAEYEADWTNPSVPSLDLSPHAPRLGIRMYDSDPKPQIDLADVVSIVRGELEA